jgi:hypothetical protein
MSESNLKIWSGVQQTDPKYTKEYSGPGGFTGTAVNAMYLAKRATEQFGPCGTGWGYEVLDDRFDVGGPLTDKATGAVLCNAQIHTIKLALWYLGTDGERKTVMHYGHTPFISQNKFGISTDLEAPKKSLTDAIGKCLSQLGFSADIRLGLYDDIHYLNEIANEAEIERAEDKIDARERQAAEYRDWLESNHKAISTAQSLNELQKLYSSAIRKLDLRKDETNKVKFTRAKDARKVELDAEGKQA